MSLNDIQGPNVFAPVFLVKKSPKVFINQQVDI